MLKARRTKITGDRQLLILPLALSLFGLFMIFDASSAAAWRDFGDRFYYVKHQALWLLLGWVFFAFFSWVNLFWLKKIALPAFLVSLILLVVVLIPGVGREVYGGRRWLPIMGFGLQPAEIMKITLTLYLATLFEKRKNFWSFVLILGLVLGLVLLEPDLGTGVLVATIAFVVYFLAGAPMKEIGLMALAGAIAGPLLILLSPYRKQRLLTFLDHSFDAQGASYHVRQVLIALGGGGFLGRGLGQSRQKFLFLPEVTTDSIFAIIAEEFGFVGATVVILVLFYLLYRAFRLILKVKDPFSQLLIAGLTASIGLQTLINLGAMVALVPLTGVPLPFISYGGSSLLVCLSAMGIIYNISKNV